MESESVSVEFDFYEVLHIRRGATSAEIQRAYKRSARLYHPDLNPGDPVAAQRYREIASAFRILSDPESRARYDRGERLVTPTVAGPSVEFQGFDFSRDGAGGFSDIFSDVPEGGAASASRGEDIEQTARLTLEEVFRGTRRRVHLVRLDRCPACDGTAEVSGATAPCPRCKGRGALRVKRGHMVFSRRCATCDGTGTRASMPCPHCGGDGRVTRAEWIEVRIPPGIDSGSRVRVPGAGNAGAHGARAGDFILAVEVEAHSVYRREGEDLVCEVPVTLLEAAAGAHVDVPTPDGPLTIEIPAGTQTGRRFRLRKRGMPRVGRDGRGDLFVQVRVVVPQVRDDRSRALVEELAQLNPGDPRESLRTQPCRLSEE